MTDHPGASNGLGSEAWLRKRSGYFREVIGYRESIDLLNDPRLLASFAGMFEAVGVTSGPLWEHATTALLSVNGEEHHRLRSLVAGSFTPRAAERLRPIARETAVSLVEELASNDTGDLIADFAVPYLIKTLSHYTGFTEAELVASYPAVEQVGRGMKDFANRLDDLEEGFGLLLSCVRTALDERREEQREDLLGQIAAQVAAGSFPEPFALGIMTAFLSAGLEPTINQVGLLVMVLSEYPDVWDAVGSGQVEPARAVEAGLRMRSTNPSAMRRVAETFDYQGVTFDEGDVVVVDIAAANHDPRQFAPDELDLNTSRSSHLAFGFGPHFCLGAALARVQLQEALRALTERVTCPTILAMREDDGSGGLVGPLTLTISLERRSSR